MKAGEKKTLEMFSEEISKLNIRGQWISDEMLVRSIGGPQPVDIPLAPAAPPSKP